MVVQTGSSYCSGVVGREVRITVLGEGGNHLLWEKERCYGWHTLVLDRSDAEDYDGEQSS